MGRARPFQRPSVAAVLVREYLQHGVMHPSLDLRSTLDVLERRRAGEDVDNDELDRLLAESGTEALARIVDRCQRKTTRAMPGRPSEDAVPGGSRAWSWS